MAGAALVGSGLLEPAYAVFPQIRFFLDKAHYEPGDAMALMLKEDVVVPSRCASPTAGHRLDQSSRTTDGRCGRHGRADRRHRDHDDPDGSVRRPGLPPGGRLHGAPGHPAPDAVDDHPHRDERAGQTSGTRGSSAVGAGLAARRIFADLGGGATSQIQLVEEAHAAGMLPVISYKVGGDIAGAVDGRVQRAWPSRRRPSWRRTAARRP